MSQNLNKILLGLHVWGWPDTRNW